MQTYSLSAPAGFIVNRYGQAVTVYDKDRNPFYFSKSAKYFNLPKGTFYIDGDVTKTPMRKLQLPRLPLPEKKEPIPNRVVTVVKPNPSKCSVARKNGVMIIWMDPEVAKLPDVLRLPIIAHEIGHLYYFTEHYCDLWAANYLMKRGWNASQLNASFHGTLGNCESSQARKQMLKEELKYNG